MLIVISPAKSLDFDTTSQNKLHSSPDMLDEALQLVNILKEKSEDEIADLMNISEKLALLNTERYASWTPTISPNIDKEALLAFKGDVYQGLEAETFSEAELTYAQSHLRILSGMYGILRPLDLIKPYRLEMGTSLQVNGYSNLYQFWGNKIAIKIKKQLQEIGSDVLVNLASQEYFKAVDKKELGKEVKVVSPVFKDFKNGQYKVISFFAKKARGQMSAWIIRNQVTTIEELKAFQVNGYAYNENLSKNFSPVFTRD